MSLPILYIVIPCFNEEAVLPITAPLFMNQLNSMKESGKVHECSKIMFVNDGSKDETWDIIKRLSEENECIVGISQSRNRGHQSTVLAGLMEAKQFCDIAISIDCDGQDEISAMDKMVDEYNNGCDVVYGVRSKRDTDTFFKRFTAEAFYKLMIAFGVEIIYNHSDYRLLSKRVLDELENFQEVNLFLRGIVPLVGFKSTSVYYERNERMAGKSHYPLKKMVAFAFDGITSLSIKPIRIFTGLGIMVSGLSFLAIIWIVIGYMLGNTVTGWASICAIVCFMGGIQLISLGVIGEYVGKIYLETKRRPRYIIEDKTYNWKNDENE